MIIFALIFALLFFSTSLFVVGAPGITIVIPILAALVVTGLYLWEDQKLTPCRFFLLFLFGLFMLFVGRSF